MFRSRLRMLLAVTALVVGPLLATIGYGLYVRSDHYGDTVAERASAFLKAHVRIGQIVPLDLASQGFRDVRVALPGQLRPALLCRLAVLRLHEEGRVEIELRGGLLDLRTDRGSGGDIQRLLLTALGHDFSRVRLGSVKVVDMDLAWRHGPLQLRIEDVAGEIDLTGPKAVLSLIGQRINGVAPDGPVVLHGSFSTAETPHVHELTLSVPRLPVEALLPPAAREALPVGPPQPAGSNGWFTGSLVYRQDQPGRLTGPLELTGSITDLHLGLLGSITGGEDFGGRVSVKRLRIAMDGRRIRDVDLRMRADRVDLAGLARALHLPNLAGIATLAIHELRYEDGAVRALLADGQILSLGLADLVRRAGHGTLTGRFDVDLMRLRIVDDRLDDLAARVRAVPPLDEPAVIDRSLLAAAIHACTGLTLPPILPEQVRYLDLGAKLHGAGDEIYIEGIAGPIGKFILIADLDPVPMPLIPQPPGPVRVAPIVEALRPQARQVLPAMLAHLRQIRPQENGREEIVAVPPGTTR